MAWGLEPRPLPTQTITGFQDPHLLSFHPHGKLFWSLKDRILISAEKRVIFKHSNCYLTASNAILYALCDSHGRHCSP